MPVSRKRVSVFVACLLLLFTCSSDAAVIWYNGDFNGVNGLADEINTAIDEARVYDDFLIGSNVTITGAFVNALTDVTGVTQASYEIRSGVSAGNGGTLVASGLVTATQTLTGRSGFGYDEYTIEVSGLDVALGPGTYWLNVAPVGFGTGRAFASQTSGLNAIGSPAGNNGNSFFDSDWFGQNFVPDFQGEVDFSMGVKGRTNVIPEPTSVAVWSLLCIAGLVFVRRRRQCV